MPYGSTGGSLHLVHQLVYTLGTILELKVGALHSLLLYQLARIEEQGADRECEHHYQEQEDTQTEFERQLAFDAIQ